MNECRNQHCWEEVFKCCVSTSISYPVFILSSVLWSLSMVERFSACGRPESVSAYPPHLSAFPLSFQTMGILWSYEGHENIVCATTELGYLNNSLDKPFASSGLLTCPCWKKQKDAVLIQQHQRRHGSRLSVLNKKSEHVSLNFCVEPLAHFPLMWIAEQCKRSVQKLEKDNSNLSLAKKQIPVLFHFQKDSGQMQIFSCSGMPAFPNVLMGLSRKLRTQLTQLWAFMKVFQIEKALYSLMTQPLPGLTGLQDLRHINGFGTTVLHQGQAPARVSASTGFEHKSLLLILFNLLLLPLSERLWPFFLQETIQHPIVMTQSSEPRQLLGTA